MTRPAVILLLAGATLVAALASLLLGARPVPLAQAWAAMTAFDRTNPDQLVVHDLRLPRTVLGLAVGGALAVSGVVMQGLTRNPLADPAIMGTGAGAALVVVLGIRVFGATGGGALAGLSLLGALAVTALVLAIGMRQAGASSRLILAGLAVTAGLGTITQGILLTSQETLQVYRFWAVGSLASSEWARLLAGLPAIVLGAGLAFGLAPGLNALALGEEAAQGLGVHVLRLRLLALLAIAALAGGAVAAAGPIGFLGLVAPPIARFALGADLRWQMPAAAMAGGAFLLCADVAGRLILPPGEVQAGIMVALVGGPAFAWIARRAAR